MCPRRDINGQQMRAAKLDETDEVVSIIKVNTCVHLDLLSKHLGANYILLQPLSALLILDLE